MNYILIPVLIAVYLKYRNDWTSIDDICQQCIQERWTSDFNSSGNLDKDDRTCRLYDHLEQTETTDTKTTTVTATDMTIATVTATLTVTITTSATIAHASTVSIADPEETTVTPVGTTTAAEAITATSAQIIYGEKECLDNYLVFCRVLAEVARKERKFISNCEKIYQNCNINVLECRVCKMNVRTKKFTYIVCKKSLKQCKRNLNIEDLNDLEFHIFDGFEKSVKLAEYTLKGTTHMHHMDFIATMLVDANYDNIGIVCGFLKYVVDSANVIEMPPGDDSGLQVIGEGCPPVCRTNNELIPHFVDCTFFYECCDKIAVMKRCPKNQVFSKKRQSCVSSQRKCSTAPERYNHCRVQL